MSTNPRYPVYVPTKGRWESLLTIRTLQVLRVPFRAVVEAQEFDKYTAAVEDPKCLLVLPHRDKGLVVTRNWIWDHARDSGAKRFWTFDDNIRGIYRFHKNRQIPVSTGACLAAIEDFVERYANVPIAGMQYHTFAHCRESPPAFTLNRRVYSNMLIETNATDLNDKPYRNEGFYNDDTDLCLRVLKDGRCTMLFNAFLIGKVATMTVRGGMTGHYQGDGRWKMAEELRRKHPDVTTVTRKWGRWQHHVDYSRFAKNALIRATPLIEKTDPNEYGMRLVHLPEALTPLADPAKVTANSSPPSRRKRAAKPKE